MKILLVDDDSNVLQALQAMLKGRPNDQVAVGINGAQAIENAADMQGVDLLITDVVMDPMDGFTLRQKLQESYPGMKTIFISGYDLSDYALYTIGCEVLAKPFTADVFFQVISKVEGTIPHLVAAPQPVATPVATPAPVATPVATPQPVAVPVATPAPVAAPVAAPQPVAMPIATPAPVTTPVATPQPVAVPVATPAPVAAKPVAAPQPVATPVAAPAPVATPVATPQPVAVPVATPAPVAAKPVAAPQPVATPVATPAPVATPVAAPQPVAVPVAAPAPVAAKPVAAPQPVATPVAAPAPAATPVATPQPVAVPVAAPAPVATPVAAPQPVVAPVAAKLVATPQPVAAQVAAPAPVATPVPVSADSASDALLNTKIGNYNILRKLNEDEWSSVYLANQTSMSRPVAMNVLTKEASDAESRKHFLSIAQAKAAVKHPAIISVYEAGEVSGYFYYTSEYVDGDHLAGLKARNVTVDDKTALQLAKVAVEGLAYLDQHKIPHVALEANHVLLDKNKEAHLANLAVLPEEGRVDVIKDAAALSAAITALLPNGTATDAGLQKLLIQMAMGEAGGFSTWETMRAAIIALVPKVIPADAVKITAHQQAAIRAVEKNKEEQKRSMMVVIAITVASLCLATWFVMHLIQGNERDLSQMVKIPAGEFIFQDGQKASTGEFWIDKYEVTIGEYARFLKALKANPTTEYDSPDQPKAKTSHIPGLNEKIWETWYGRARIGKPAQLKPIDLNCPIFNVDYWDAYAYAKWAGKRLPTEVEWEKAARGTDGRLYPWGNTFDPKKANLGKDCIERPGPNSKGVVDGYFWWSPVDAMKGDCSPYGVIGMLGNMAEWTATWDPQTKGPILRGGSFHKEEATVTFRAGIKEVKPPIGASDSYEFVGFRCVSDTPPKK